MSVMPTILSAILLSAAITPSSDVPGAAVIDCEEMEKELSRNVEVCAQLWNTHGSTVPIAAAISLCCEISTGSPQCKVAFCVQPEDSAPLCAGDWPWDDQEPIKIGNAIQVPLSCQDNDIRRSIHPIFSYEFDGHRLNVDMDVGVYNGLMGINVDAYLDDIKVF